MSDILSLRFENLTFAYPNEAPLFESASFEFPMNEIVWILSENGAGRSTLLQLLAVLLSPQRGAFLINEQDTTPMTFEEFLPYRLNIGYGFDLGGVIHNRTMLENLMLPLIYHEVLPYPDAKKRAERYMDRMGILRYKDLRPSLVPGGVRKVICLIRALILHPQVLLLDDPTVGLGFESGLRFFDLVSDLRAAGNLRHVFLSSFDEKFMLNMQFRQIAIDDKRIHHFPGDIAPGVAS
ncbi:MAG: ABC transporter ATP-binding protein [Bdellovibrio sp.]|nr:MAG: ABC transporter ATP-binding protein [Bdellovibrio sp.]